MVVRILITGASGVLGSAIYNAFKNADSSVTFEVKGLSYTQKSDALISVDITDEKAVESVIAENKPDWVIHCAAERRPDVAEKNPEAAHKLNALTPGHLAALSASSQHPFTLIYISTDYVFDGTSPPYEVNDKPNPVQFYGVTKREGEVGVLSVREGKGRRIVLRVPVLYGPTKEPKDTSINLLEEIVKDQSGKTYKMDHYATRYPTNVLDIANFLVRLAALPKPIPPILHYTAPEPYTKYEMCLVLSSILNLPHAHIIPEAEPPNDGVLRPKDCKLSTKVIEEDLGIDLECTGFEEWWRGWLGRVSG